MLHYHPAAFFLCRWYTLKRMFNWSILMALAKVDHIEALWNSSSRWVWLEHECSIQQDIMWYFVLLSHLSSMPILSLMTHVNSATRSSYFWSQLCRKLSPWVHIIVILWSWQSYNYIQIKNTTSFCRSLLCHVEGNGSLSRGVSKQNATHVEVWYHDKGLVRLDL